MKNICFFLLVTMLMGMITACDNPDIDIVNKHELKIHVSTSNPYNQFDLIGTYTKAYLQDDDFYLSINTLLYDENGNYVDSVRTYSKTLDAVNQNFDGIREGDYTIVTTITMVEKSNNYQSLFWELSSIERLSTISVHDRGDIDYCPGTFLVGIDCQKVKLKSNASVSMEPQAIGSIVYMMWEGLEQTKYTSIGVVRKDKPNGYIINPELNGEEHFEYDTYYDSNVWSYIGYRNKMADCVRPTAPFFVMGKNDLNWGWGLKDNDNTNKFSLFMNGGHYQMAAGNTYYTFFMYNEKNEGEIFFGTLEEKDAWYRELSILFKVPYTEWGADVSAVKNYMSGFTLGESSPVKVDEHSYVYWYYPKYKEIETDYYFEKENTGLNASIVFLNPQNTTTEDIKAFIEKTGDYYYGGKSNDGDDYYISNDDKTYILIYLNNQGGYVVQFAEFKPSYSVNSVFKCGVPSKKQCSAIDSIHSCELYDNHE